MSTGIRGVDLTWSNWLFEKDGLTPSATYGRFAHAARMIRTYYAIGRRLAPYPPGEAARPTAPGSWTLACVDSTRLMGSFPDVIKGNDPEIAAVEGAQTQRMLLRFPMELLPAGRRIRRARLVLKRFRNYDDSGSRAVLGIYRVTQPWSGLDADWRHATAGTLWTRPGGTAVDKRGCPYVRGSAVVPWASAEAAPFTKAGDIVAFDVTTLCREMAMVANYGMMIVVDGPRNANESFGSQAHPDPGMRPALYVEPGPAPAIARAASVFVAPARSTVIPW